MKIADYLQMYPNAEFARGIGISPAYLSQIKHGLRPFPLDKVYAAEVLTSGVVTRKEERPDDYWLIWPDLAKDAGHEVKEQTPHE